MGTVTTGADLDALMASFNSRIKEIRNLLLVRNGGLQGLGFLGFGSIPLVCCIQVEVGLGGLSFEQTSVNHFEFLGMLSFQIKCSNLECSISHAAELRVIASFIAM